MAHKSEHAKRLRISATQIADVVELPAPEPNAADVWLLVLPFGWRLGDSPTRAVWLRRTREFAESLGPDALLAILTSPEDAAVTWLELSKTLRFQLWVAVKLHEPILTAPTRLPEHHAALLVLSKYRSPLRHAKTRIGYTYCPTCDKTTKDYGGKKHTYHSFGTLMSDVWRDLTWEPGSYPTEVVGRLADLFGLEPHRRLHVVSLLSDQCPNCPEPEPAKSQTGIQQHRGSLKELESRLIQGDCLDSLRGIPDNSVDFCFADPPYNLAKRYDGSDDAIDIVQYFNWCDQWLDELARILRPGRTCAVLNIPQWAIRHFSHMRTSLQFQNWIVWEGLSLPVRMIMPAHYSILCFSKGAAREIPGLTHRENSPAETEALAVLRELYCLRASCCEYRRRKGTQDRGEPTDLWWDIHRLKHNSRRVDHPCQLPPALMRRLIALFTFPDEILIDPFNGAGTTSLCAEAMGRRYIGIELSQRYHDLAVQRHQFLRQGGDPFGKVDRIPRAKNSRVKRIGNVEYDVPKKVLQLEVRDIARKLGRLPTRDDVQRLSNYPIRYFDEYFLSWGEVCAAARTTGMRETRGSSRKSSRQHQPMLFDVMTTSKR